MIGIIRIKGSRPYSAYNSERKDPDGRHERLRMTGSPGGRPPQPNCHAELREASGLAIGRSTRAQILRCTQHDNLTRSQRVMA